MGVLQYLQALACRICDGPVQDPFQQDRQWWVADRWCQANARRPGPGDSFSLDSGLMQEAAACLAGKRCFGAFQDSSERLPGNTVRHVWHLQVLHPMIIALPADSDRLLTKQQHQCAACLFCQAA